MDSEAVMAQAAGQRTYELDPQNANKGTQRGLGMVERSLQSYGAGRSILASADGVILAGNKTYERAQELGIPVQEIESDGRTLFVIRRTDLPYDDPRAKELAIADNRASETGLAWDADVLAALAEDGVDLDQFWFEDELADVLGEPEATEGLTDPDAVPEPPAEPITKPGDVWLLGEHRLMCGDATQDIAKLGRADLVMTSPPYWVGKEYENEKTWDEVRSFIAAVAGNIGEVMEKQGRIVINTGTTPASSLTGKRAHIKLLLDEWQEQLEHYGYLLRYARIWAKRGQLGLIAPSMDVVDQHWEFIGVFYHPDNYKGQRRVGEKWATDGLWEMHGEMSSHGHVAAFPVEIPSRNIRLYTDRGDVVMDPFTGSGTTLIACEELGRVFRGLELSPAYCDVIVNRWEQFTGRTAEREVEAEAAD